VALSSAEDTTPLCRLIPGDRVQLDTCTIAPRCYQYTAGDVCTRYQVPAFFRRRTAISTLVFVARVLEEMPFPLGRRVQTDRGQGILRGVGPTVVDRPWHQIPSHQARLTAPEWQSRRRSQKTIARNSGLMLIRTALKLEWWLPEWQHDDNWDRPHGSLNGQTSSRCDSTKSVRTRRLGGKADAQLQPWQGAIPGLLTPDRLGAPARLPNGTPGRNKVERIHMNLNPA